MATRLQAILARYRWRTPFVVAVLGAHRLSTVRSVLFGSLLNLLTQGAKGRGVFWGREVSVSPGSWLEVGSGGYVGDRCTFVIQISSGARVSVGDDFWISHDCHIVSHGRIHIGSHVMIGEFTSLRDSTHAHERLDVPMKRQSDVPGTITIEDDVWIGRGVLIQGRPGGVVIGTGAIIGAHSLVSRSVPPHAIVAGSPARLIRFRTEQDDAAAVQVLRGENSST